MIARPMDPTAEPAAGSGFQWVPAGRLASLRFPEANEAIARRNSAAGAASSA